MLVDTTTSNSSLGADSRTMASIDDMESMPYEDPFDDVFGAESNDEEAVTNNHTSVQAFHANNERSEIPRLRSTHVTNGYRDGVAESKSRFVQEGFDEGYSLGAQLGFKAAWLLAVLKRLPPGTEPELSFETASIELAIGNILSLQFFSEEGIWKYDVPGADEELDFDTISNAHPMICKWIAILHTKARGARVVLDIPSSLAANQDP